MSLYKFLLAGGRSANGNISWKVGEWREVKGPLALCRNGFHASRAPLDALRYVAGEIHYCPCGAGFNIAMFGSDFVVAELIAEPEKQAE